MTDSKFFKVGVSVLAFVLAMALVVSTRVDVDTDKAYVTANEKVEISVSEIAKTVVGVSACDNDSGEQKVGSGVAVDENGYIITSNSVIGDMHSSIFVTLSDGRKISAVPVWKNEVYDIAVVKADCKIENTACLGDAKEVQLGDRVYAIGTFGGVQFQSTVSEGVISGVYRTVAGEINGENVLIEDLMQTDADIAVNSRGGALVDGDGEVIGIIGVNESGSFAVPVNVVSPIIEKLSEGEAVQEIKLGVYCYDSRMMQYLSQDFEKSGGVTAACLTDGSAAEKSGIMLGDVITEVNGKKIDTMIEFYEEVNSTEINGELTFGIERGDERMKIKILTAQLK